MKDKQSVFFLHIRFCSLSKNSTSPETSGGTDMTTVFHARLYGRFIEIKSILRRKELHRTNQGSNSLGHSFHNRDNERTPIQFRKESQPRHLQTWFFFNKKPINFYINSTNDTRLVKLNQLNFLVLRSTDYSLPQSTVCCR